MPLACLEDMDGHAWGGGLKVAQLPARSIDIGFGGRNDRQGDGVRGPWNPLRCGKAEERFER